MKRVVSVVQNHFVNDNRVWRTADTLQKEGYDVLVVCIHKDGLPECEVMDGVKVHRVKIKSQKLPPGKIFGLVKFVEMFARIILQYRNWDIWHCNDLNPFTMGVIAKMLNRKLKLVYDSHEYQTERIDKSTFQTKVIKFVESQYIHKAEAVIVVSGGIASEYERLYGLEDVKIVRNVPHKIELHKRQILREELNIPPEEMIFLCQGKIGKGRGIEPLLEAFSKFEGRGATLVVMGDGEYRNKVEDFAERYSNIIYREPVPYHDLVRYSASADVGLVSPQNLCLNYWFCLPNKLFEYIQAELPVMTNNLIECEKLVRERNIGFVVDGWEANKIVEAIAIALETDLKIFHAQLLKAKEDLNWEKEQDKLMDIYGKL